MRVPADFDAHFPDGSARATETFLNVGMLTGGVQAAVVALLRRHGMTSLAAFNVLTIVDGDPQPVLPSEIAARMMVTRATMTGLIDSLERRGLVQRRNSLHDARQRLVATTPDGHALATRLVPLMHRFEQDLMGCLDDDELDQLLTFTTRLQHRLRELAPDVPLGIH